MSLMIGAVVIVIIVAGAAFFMSGKSGAKNTAQSETQEKKGSEGKETAVVQEKAESADKSQSAEAREKKAKTESVLENDKEKGTGENTEKIISENQKVKNEEKVDFKEKNRQKEQLYYYIILIMNYRLFLLLIIKENGIGLKNWEICLPLYIRKKKVLSRDCHLLQEQW